MKKEIIKPFDLEKAKAGAKLKTKDGNPVEIFKFDARGKYPVQGTVICKDEDSCASWNSKGEWFNDEADTFNLVIVEEVEEPEFWSDKENKKVKGYLIDYISNIITHGVLCYNKNHYSLFATKKQAKSALAMARISQIMANDIENFGGVVTDEEWDNNERKFIIYRYKRRVCTSSVAREHHLLAFHKSEQRDMFLEKYPQLVHDFLMIPDEETK